MEGREGISAAARSKQPGRFAARRGSSIALGDQAPPAALLDDVIQQALTQLQLKEFLTDDTFLTDLRESLASCLEFHSIPMRRFGHGTWEEQLDLLRQGRHVQERSAENGDLSLVLVESRGIIPEDLVLARACSWEIAAAREAFAARYFTDWRDYLEALPPVHQRRFSEECESLWSLFLHVSDSGRRQWPYIEDYNGRISLYSFLRMITRTKYIDWRKRLPPPPPLLGDAPGALRPDWLEVSDCYQLAAQSLIRDLTLNPQWLNPGEELVLFQEIFDENDSRVLQRLLDVGASMVSTYRKNLATKLEQRYGMTVKPHRRECACIDLWRIHPEGKPRFAQAVTVAGAAWVEKTRAVLRGANS